LGITDGTGNQATDLVSSHCWVSSEFWKVGGFAALGIVGAKPHQPLQVGFGIPEFRGDGKFSNPAIEGCRRNGWTRKYPPLMRKQMDYLIAAVTL